MVMAAAGAAVDAQPDKGCDHTDREEARDQQAHEQTSEKNSGDLFADVAIRAIRGAEACRTRAHLGVEVACATPGTVTGADRRAVCDSGVVDRTSLDSKTALGIVGLNRDVHNPIEGQRRRDQFGGRRAVEVLVNVIIPGSGIATAANGNPEVSCTSSREHLYRDLLCVCGNIVSVVRHRVGSGVEPRE